MSQGEGILFTEFLDELHVETEAGQRAFCRVAFDGVQPCDLDGDDRAWASKIFGDLARLPPEAWALVLSVVGIVAGGRSGKTYLCSLRLLHLALVTDLSELAPGEEAFCAIVAPRLELAEQSLRYVAGAAREHPEIARLIVSDTKAGLVLRRDDGERVAIRPFAAAAGGIGGRGKTLIAVLLDETCFFRDKDSGVVNDETIFNAASVRVIEGGQTLVSSTPWVGRGLLFNLWKKNFGHAIDALVAHTDTRWMRTKAHILAIVARAFARNPKNAAIEFGAEWGSVTIETFFSDAELDALFDGTAPELGRPPQAGERVSFGGDLGFTRNSSTLAGVHELPDGLALLAHLDEHQPPPGVLLKPSVVCQAFARTIAGQGGLGIVADSHEKASLHEHMSAAGLSVYPAPAASDALVALRAAIRDGQVKAPLHERLRSQLASLKAKRTVGDHLQVVIPEAIDGSHCDLAVAFAQAVWGLGPCGSDVEAPQPNHPGDPWNEQENREIERRERAQRDRADELGAEW